MNDNVYDRPDMRTEAVVQPTVNTELVNQYQGISLIVYYLVYNFTVSLYNLRFKQGIGYT